MMRKSSLWLGWAATMLLLASPTYGAGFDKHYVAYYGDANNDGRTDIYLKWEPKIALVPLDDVNIPVPLSRRDVSNTLLTQTASGGFIVDTSAAVPSQWPKLPQPAFVAIMDFNMDGYMDIALRSLSSLSPTFPSSLLDQVVFAPEVRGQRPSLVKVIDAEIVKFFTELYGWLTNEQYFKQNARQIPATAGEYSSYLGYILKPYPPYYAAVCVFYDTCRYRFGNINDPYVDPNDTDGTQNVWHWWGITIVTGTTRPDYSVFDPRAMEVASKLKNVVLGNETITPGSDLERTLEILVGDVLDVIVYGGVFDEGTPDYEDDEGWVIDEYKALLELAAQLTSTGWNSLNFYNPLPNAYINKKDDTNGRCTADGRFGYVRSGGTQPHDGVDLGTSPLTPVEVGTPVYAVWDGVAEPYTQRKNGKVVGWGVTTKLFVEKWPHYFVYAHLSTPVKGWIPRASIAGYVGRTGNVTCQKTHLHFEIKDLRDPAKMIDPASESSVFQWLIEP